MTSCVLLVCAQLQKDGSQSSLGIGSNPPWSALILFLVNPFSGDIERTLGTRVRIFLPQSRSQSPRAPRSADGRPGETLGKWNFYPRNLGFRLLCACFARKTEVKNWKKTEGSGVRRKYLELHSLDMQLVK